MSGGAALRTATLLLTRACNLSCEYCPRDRRRTETMSRATLHRALDVALDLAGSRLTIELSGGEPLLAPGLLREALVRLRAPASGGPRTACRLQTNGLLLDATTLGLLVEHDVQLQLSFDGPQAQAQRGPGTYAALDGTLRAIRRRYADYWRRRVDVASVFTPATVPHLGETVAYFLAQDVPRLGIAPACGYSAWGAATCAALVRQMAVVERLALEYRSCTGRAPLQYLSVVTDGAFEAVCGAGLRRGLTVDADGVVHGCAQLARAAGEGLGRSQRRLAAALIDGDVSDPRFSDHWRAAPDPARDLAVLRSRAGWSCRGVSCADCPLVTGCRVCPLAGPVPGDVPDAHCLFERLAHEQRQRFQHSDPVAGLLRAGGLAGARLRRAMGWLRATGS